MNQLSPKRFIILASMRTGSNALNAHINQLDRVVCHGEAFNHTFVGLHEKYFAKLDIARDETQKRDRDPVAFLNLLLNDPDAKAVGLHIFPGDPPAILDLLLRDPGVRKIGLRRSVFQSYASLLIAQKTNVWRINRAGNGPAVDIGETPKVLFQPADFERYKAKLDGFWRHVMKTLGDTDQKMFPMWYSKINQTRMINAIAEHIGIDSRLSALKQKTVRQNPVDLSQKVENWEEMQAYAKAQGLEAHLY